MDAMGTFSFPQTIGEVYQFTCWLLDAPAESENFWDVMGCQVATCFEALKRGVMNGGSGVSIVSGEMDS